MTNENITNEHNVFNLIKQAYIPDLEYCFDFLAKFVDRIKETYADVKMVPSDYSSLNHTISCTINNKFKVLMGISLVGAYQGVPQVEVTINQINDNNKNFRLKYFNNSNITFSDIPYNEKWIGWFTIGRFSKVTRLIDVDKMDDPAFLNFINDSLSTIVDELDPNDPVKITDDKGDCFYDYCNA